MEKLKLNRALTKKTAQLFDEISQLDCIKGLYLCGGTSQALQLYHRKSEDMDFELIDIRKDRPALNMSEIIREITNKFRNVRRDIFSESHFELYINDSVKLSFFRPENNVPYLNPGIKINNIQTVSLQDLLGMKLFTITQRNVFRDYYDIYCVLKAGGSLSEGIRYACNFSKHSVHSRSIYNTLLSDTLFFKPSDFQLLDPLFEVTPKEINEYIKSIINQEKDLKDKAFEKKPNINAIIIKEPDRKRLTSLGINEKNIFSLESSGHLVVNEHYYRLTEDYDDKSRVPIEKTLMEFSFHDGTVFVIVPKTKQEIPLRQAIIESKDITRYASKTPAKKKDPFAQQVPGIRKKQ